MMKSLYYPLLKKNTNNSLSTVNCTDNESENLINVLNINKSSGDDRISHRMLKGVSKYISKALSILMNRSFNEGIFPETWKAANVIPNFKKSDKSLPSNHRPVALLSCVGKLQERIIFLRIRTIILLISTCYINTSQDFFLAILQFSNRLI